MKHPITKIGFVRYVMAGLFAGIVAAIAGFAYVQIYRSITSVSAYSFFMNPLSIFIGIPLIATLSGILLIILARYSSKGFTWFTILFILLTVFGIVASIAYPMESQPKGAKGLLIGLEVITGLAIACLIPYLVRHPNIFMTRLGRNAS